MAVGIDKISFYSSAYSMDLATLAEARGLPAKRFTSSIGQQCMGVVPPGEDIVTLAANAADQVLDGEDRSRIAMLIFGTESGIDQSKAAGVYVHGLLDLPARCRVYEVKQACYGATAGLQAGLDYLYRHPGQKVLVVAGDVARYGLGSAGEPTQGAGAVAMLLSHDPRLLAIGPESGVHTEDVMDFWRPNYRDEALVDGKASVRVYLRSLSESFAHYCEQTGHSFADIDHFCYHLPFTRMGETAHAHLIKSLSIDTADGSADAKVTDSLHYNPLTGNSYAASLYIGLCSLLDTATADLSGQRVGLFSYGSGCMAEFYTGVVQPGYRDHLLDTTHRDMLAQREPLDVATYEQYYTFRLPTDGTDLDIPPHNTGRFRLTALHAHKRLYQRVER